MEFSTKLAIITLAANLSACEVTVSPVTLAGSAGKADTQIGRVELLDNASGSSLGFIQADEVVDFDKLTADSLKLSVTPPTPGTRISFTVASDPSRDAEFGPADELARYLLKPGNYDLQIGLTPSTETPGSDFKIHVRCDQKCKDFKIVVLGSSTAYGTGASVPEDKNGWVGLLTKKFSTVAGQGFSINNLAVNGYVSASLLPDTNPAHEQSKHNISQAVSQMPDLIIVSIPGGNDVMASVANPDIVKNLLTLQAFTDQANIPIFFVGAMPRTSFPASTLAKQRDQLAKLNDVELVELATCRHPQSGMRAKGCFVDIFSSIAAGDLSVRQDLAYRDGIHLNDSGHKLLSELVFNEIKNFVCSRTVCEQN